MTIDIYERACYVANYMLDQRATLRQAASALGVSKSTIHTDITKVLPQVNPILASQTKILLEGNMAIRHIRGGQATKRKFLAIKR